MKYLVNLEGEFPNIINGEEKLNEFLEDRARERRGDGCENVDQWLEEMKTQKFSQVYTNYPEIIIDLDDYVIR